MTFLVCGRQILCEFPHQYSFYPGNFENLSNELEQIATLGLSNTLIALECLAITHTDLYFQFLLITTIPPIAMVAMGVLGYTVYTHWLRISSTHTLRTQKRIQNAHHWCMGAFFLFTYIIFVPCRSIRTPYPDGKKYNSP